MLVNYLIVISYYVILINYTNYLTYKACDTYLVESHNQVQWFTLIVTRCLTQLGL